MSYLIRLVPELRAWLADLCAIDPAAAELAGAAITVLLTDGERAGPPLIVPAGTAAPLDPRDALDDSYQRLLSQLTGVRRAVAGVAAARKRLELQIGQLAAAEGSAQRTGTLHQLRDEYARLGMEEARLGTGAQQLQSWVSEFRSRKEALKASYAVAEAQRAINNAYAEFGTQAEGASAPFPAADDSIQSLAGSIAGITRAAAQEPPPGEPATAAPGAVGRPEVMLAELRCGWPSEQPQRILFTIEDGGPAEDEGPPGAEGPAVSAVAVLLAAGPAVSPLRGEADALIPLALDRYLAARDQPGTRYTSESFGREFFPASTGRVRAAATALAARTLPRPPGQLRRQAGVTQAELAERLGVRQERVSAIERADPGAAEVRTLAGYVQALGGRLVLVADFGADQVILG